MAAVVAFVAAVAFVAVVAIVAVVAVVAIVAVVAPQCPVAALRRSVRTAAGGERQSLSSKGTGCGTE